MANVISCPTRRSSDLVFDFSVDGQPFAFGDDLGDNDATEAYELLLSGFDHTVQEHGNPGTDLADYDTKLTRLNDSEFTTDSPVTSNGTIIDVTNVQPG